MLIKNRLLLIVILHLSVIIYAMEKEQKLYLVRSYLEKKYTLPREIQNIIFEYAQYKHSNKLCVQMTPTQSYRRYTQTTELLSKNINTLDIVPLARRNSSNTILNINSNVSLYCFKDMVTWLDNNTIRIENMIDQSLDEFELKEENNDQAILFDGFNYNKVALMGFNQMENAVPVHTLYLISKKNPFKIFNPKAKLIHLYTAPQPNRIDALALYYNHNNMRGSYFMVCSSHNNTFKATCYHAYSYKLQYSQYHNKHISEWQLSERVKKICMLSPALSLILSTTGIMHCLHIDKEGERWYTQKKILNAQNQELSIKNFAVNAVLPYLIVLLSSDDTLYLLNLKVKKEKPFMFTQLATNIQTENLWFYNDTIAYIDNKLPDHIHVNQLLYAKLEYIN